MRTFLVLLFLVGCGGSEPANDLLGRRANQPGAPGDVGAEPAATNDPAATSQTDPTDGDAGSTQGDASTPTPSDSGTPTASTDPFTGAPAYVAQNGPSTIKGDHPFPGGNPAKQNCMQSQCHGAGGSGPRFIAGGSVFKDIAGTMPAAQIEVRIRDANGDARIARTDVNGNFYFTAGNNTVDFPARTGARDGTNTRTMAATIAAGDCNSSSCHGGPQGVIHVP